MAYTYSVRVRLTGPAGPATTYDLSAWQWVNVQTTKDAAVISEQEMLDFTVEQTRYGSRRSVVLEFSLPTASTSNETDLATILQRALDDEWTVEMSLDGGTTYRTVVLSSYDAGDMEDQKLVGRMVSTVWTVKTLQTGPVAVMGGAW